MNCGVAFTCMLMLDLKLIGLLAFVYGDLIFCLNAIAMLKGKGLID